MSETASESTSGSADVAPTADVAPAADVAPDVSAADEIDAEAAESAPESWAEDEVIDLADEPVEADDSEPEEAAEPPDETADPLTWDDDETGDQTPDESLETATDTSAEEESAPEDWAEDEVVDLAEEPVEADDSDEAVDAATAEAPAGADDPGEADTGHASYDEETADAPTPDAEPSDRSSVDESSEEPIDPAPEQSPEAPTDGAAGEDPAQADPAEADRAEEAAAESDDQSDVAALQQAAEDEALTINESREQWEDHLASELLGDPTDGPVEAGDWYREVAAVPDVDLAAMGIEPVWRTDAEPLWRGVPRPEGDPFASDLAPKDPSNVSYEQYVVDDVPSAFVASSRDPSVAEDFATRRGTQEGFVYQIDAPGGIDAAATLDERYPYDEQEISFPGGLRREHVMGGWEVGADRTPGPWQANPHYIPSSDRSN